MVLTEYPSDSLGYSIKSLVGLVEKGGITMNEQKLREAVVFYAMHHDTMRLPAEWLKYIPCRYEVYYRYSTNDGDEVANVFLYHDEKKEG